jgi:hypothetical protein
MVIIDGAVECILQYGLFLYTRGFNHLETTGGPKWPKTVARRAARKVW